MYKKKCKFKEEIEVRKTVSKITSFVLALLLVCTMVPTIALAEGTTWYVNGAVSDGDGTTEATAFDTIAEAVEQASKGDTIKIYAFAGEYDAFELNGYSGKNGITFEGVAVDGKKPIIACGKALVGATNNEQTGVVGKGDVTNTTFIGLEFKNYGNTKNWVDSCICVSQATGANWEGLVIQDCDFTLVEGAAVGYAIAPHCGDLTVTGCKIIGYDSGICLMCDGGALTNVSISDNVIEVKNEVVSAYWGIESDDNVTSTVTISDNTIVAADDESTPVINITDYAYQQGKANDAIEAIVISNNEGEAKVVAGNINKSDVEVQEDMELIKTFHTGTQGVTSEGLAANSSFVKENEGFYIGYNAASNENQVYELGANGEVEEHKECTETELLNKVVATCTTAGFTGDEVCIVCEKVVKGGEVVKATGHKEVVVNAVAATCTKAGYTGDTVCETCKVELAKGKATAATGHKYVNGVCEVCKTAEPKVETETKAPNTGDNSAVMTYAVMAVAALAVVVVLKKRNAFVK